MGRFPPRKALVIFSAFFFCSGAAGLIYEVLWMRQFGLVMGNTTISLSAVLTSFMGGLAIGSWIGGRIADRWADHLRLYGILEVLIGLYALGVPLFIAATRPILAPIYQADPNGFALISVRFALALLIMIVPTIFMGATLPILIKHFTARGDEVGRRVGLIYGINTFGAMFGAFLAGFILIPRLGMNLTNLTAVIINLGVGILAVMLGWTHRGLAEEPAKAQSVPRKPAVTHSYSATPREIWAALAGIALSGMAAMIYQVCWTRMFALLLGSSVYSFSMVVMANICGLAVGGVVLGRWIDRSRRPLIFFAVIQLLVAIVCYAIVFFSEHYPLYILRMLKQFGSDYSQILLWEFSFISVLIFVPTFMMGGMFPIAARICARDVGKLGKTIGSVYAFNTVGAVIGSLTAGLVFMNFFGLWNAVLVAVGLNLIAALIAFAAQSQIATRPRLSGIVPLLAIAVVIFLAPSRWQQQMMSVGPFYASQFENLELTMDQLRKQASQGKLLYYKDDLSGTVMVQEFNLGVPNRTLSINGKIDASSGPRDMPTQLLVGHLGTLSHPQAESAMVIGLGAGFTLGALTQNENLTGIDLIEISASVIEAVRTQFHELTWKAMDDPRVNIIAGDGRNHLTLTDKKYDIIINQPSNPWIAGISNLFTREFFQSALDHLNDNGVMVQWMHTYDMQYEDFLQVIRTFMSTMPHAMIWETNDGDFLMVGSKRVLQYDWSELHETLNQDAIKRQLSPLNLDDPMVLMSSFVAMKEQIQTHPDYQKAPINADDTCRLEFSAPKALYEKEKFATPLQMVSLRHSPVPLFGADSLSPEVKDQLERIKPAKEIVARVLEQEVPDDPNRTVALFEKAVALSPRDPLIRRRATEFCIPYMLDAFNRLALEDTRKWALRIVDMFDDLNASLNAWEQGQTYRILYYSAKGLNDEANMQRGYEGLEKIAGKEFAEKMTEPVPEIDAAQKKAIADGK